MSEISPVVADPRPVFYKSVELSPSKDDPRRLVFIAARDAPKQPDELQLLRRGYEQTARVVSILFEDEVDIRKEMFLMMHLGADCGTRGSDFRIEDGRTNLEEIRQSVLDKAHTIRNKRLSQYTWLAVMVGIVPFILGAVVLHTRFFGWFDQPVVGQAYDPLFAWIVAFLWIPAGAAICVWGEFALRMQAGLSYDQLLNMDPSRWRPGQRLLITVGISFILAFLLFFDAVQVGVGRMLLNDFAKKTPAMALAVGGITGLAFATVQDIIFRMKPSLK
jgi:hypothetical protein